MKFLKALRLDSCKAFVLMNPSGLLLSLLQLQPLLRLPLKCLRKVSIYRSLGWVSDTWWSLIGDTCHSLIGPLMSSLTCVRLLVSSLTCALMHDWFLHDT